MNWIDAILTMPTRLAVPVAGLAPGITYLGAGIT